MAVTRFGPSTAMPLCSNCWTASTLLLDSVSEDDPAEPDAVAIRRPSQPAGLGVDLGHQTVR
jgi:hypothetical protein